MSAALSSPDSSPSNVSGESLTILDLSAAGRRSSVLTLRSSEMPATDPGMPILGSVFLRSAFSALLIFTSPPPAPATPPAALSIEAIAAFRIDSKTFFPVSGPCPVNVGDSGTASENVFDVNFPRAVKRLEDRTLAAADRAS